MPKRLIKRYLPDAHKIREHRHLQLFGERLHDPNLWHLNRRSVAGAMGIGVFLALLPFPGQMVMAAAAAIWLRINLPLAVATVWITNPFTFTPIFYFNYKVGTWILGIEYQRFTFQLSLEWLMRETGTVWKPLLIGSLFVAALLGLSVYVMVRVAWRFYIIRKRRQIGKPRLRKIRTDKT